MKRILATAVAMIALCAPRPAPAAQGTAPDPAQRHRELSRSCEAINLNANELADCRVRLSAAKNDAERAQVLKFFEMGGDQRAADPDSAGHAVSGKDTQHTPSRDIRKQPQ
jgi:hypothetical protein